MNRRSAASAARTRAQDAAAILAAVVASAGKQDGGCPNCPLGYDCETGHYFTTGTSGDGTTPDDERWTRP